MRYAVISKSLKPDQLESEIKKAGGSDIVKTKLLGHFFCEMDETQAGALAQVSGVMVKAIKEYKTHQVTAALAAVQTFRMCFICCVLILSAANRHWLTVAVLDSGIRKSHQSLVNKVVYEANFSGSPAAMTFSGTARK